MRAIPLLLNVFLIIGCTPKDVGPSTDPDEDSGAGDGDGESIVWENLAHDTSREFTDAYFDGSTLYVTARATSGDAGETWKWEDGEWISIPYDSTNNLNALWGNGSAPSLSMVAVGEDGMLADWNGTQWVTTADSTTNFLGVDGPNPNQLMAVGGGGIWDNMSGGWARQQVDSDDHLNDIWFDGTTAVAVGNDGTIATYLDGEWSFEQHSSGAHLYGVSGKNNQDVWAVGSEGTVIHFDGTTWETIDLGILANLWDVWSPGLDKAFVVGTNGEAYKIENTTIEELPTGVLEHLLGVTGTNETNVWAVGSQGMALRLIVD